jgi:ribosomal protein S18 acetylase RimI-like enzyme
MKIYEASFPHKERHTVDVISQRIRSGKQFLFAWIDNNKIIGIALFWDLGVQKAVIMDYYAIDIEYRNVGIGDNFLRQILAHFHSHNSNLIIEIENPFIDESEIKSRRMKFYEKLNFKIIKGFNYLMPSINNLGPVDMILMINPAVAIEKINKAEMKQLIGKIYQEMYYQSTKSPFYKVEISKIDKDYLI